jgi:hypothetical protein
LLPSMGKTQELLEPHSKHFIFFVTYKWWVQ